MTARASFSHGGARDQEANLPLADNALDAFDGDAEAEAEHDAEPSADREHWTQPANLLRLA